MVSIMVEPTKLSPAEVREQDERTTRYANRILAAICKAMPRLTEGLKIRGDKRTVTHEVDIPGLKDLDQLILPSYVIVKGENARIVYFAVMRAKLFEQIREVLASNEKLLTELTSMTTRIQFSCPETKCGFGFAKRSKGFLRGKEVLMEAFDLDEKVSHLKIPQ
jgi:hypothetical protein